jgi:hypothetical protein
MVLRLELYSSINTLAAAAALSFSAAGCSLSADFDPETHDGFEPTVQETTEGPSDVAEVGAPEMEVGAAETELSAPPSIPSAPEREGNPTSSVQTRPPAGEQGTTTATPTEEPPAAATEPTLRATITTSGRDVLDSCGNKLVVRGVEQIFGEQLPEGNDWVGLLEQIADSGVNAVRILAGTNTLSNADVESLVQAAVERQMVVYMTPYGSQNMQWLGEPDVREMITKYEKHIIIDAFGEPTFDDRARFLADSTEAIRQVREWGYRVPLTVTANQFGRDLPSLLELGAQIVASDPLNNTILGWQAYWSNTGYYQSHYGMSLEQAVDAVATAPFPIQLGLDHVTDFPSDATADFGALMSATEAHGIGWLWWDWYNPYGNENNLTVDGTAARLTATGNTVVNTHAASVQNTSRYACSAQP